MAETMLSAAVVADTAPLCVTLLSTCCSNITMVLQDEHGTCRFENCCQFWLKLAMSAHVGTVCIPLHNPSQETYVLQHCVENTEQQR